MTDTKRMPKPMTSEELAQYRELHARLMVQAERIMSVFNPLNDQEDITEVEFAKGRPLGPQVNIFYDGYACGKDYHEYFVCPENYFSMTAAELKAEKKRLAEEEKRKFEERAAKAKATREKRKAEKAIKEKGKRYKKYLELKKEFESENKPAKEAVYRCKHWGLYDDDPAGGGESWSWCHNPARRDSRECDCDRIYAQQFCPYYKKGKLAGKWVISDADVKAAEEFKKKFERKE